MGSILLFFVSITHTMMHSTVAHHWS